MRHLTGTRNLTYKGDRTSSVSQVVGPDMFGGMWQIVDAEFDPFKHKTRVGLVPYVPVADLVEDVST